MRLWSLHPQYLDAKGLVALWREGLLAQKVLQGNTKGYKNHPQLLRFKQMPDPVSAIASYLSAVVIEAEQRGYHFDKTKIAPFKKGVAMCVTKGQVDFEWDHLKSKLKIRDVKKYLSIKNTLSPKVHPSFKVVNGAIEAWEKL